MTTLAVDKGEGPQVVLRDVVDEDLPIFYEHPLDPDASRMAAFAPRDRHSHMAHWATIMSDDTVIKKAVVADDEVVGNIGAWLVDDRRFIGYWIARAQWGRGIATSAVSSFVDQIDERPLYAHVAAHNIASIRVLEKCGFEVIEGPYSAAGYGDVDAVDELLLSLVGEAPRLR